LYRAEPQQELRYKFPCLLLQRIIFLQHFHLVDLHLEELLEFIHELLKHREHADILLGIPARNLPFQE
jgi:hypothetical protein